MEGAYFDNNATTPVDPGVIEEVARWLGGGGNPSSAHRWGQRARGAADRARAAVASLIGADPEQVVFTASGTEANNAVVDTAARAAGGSGRIVISALEHPSVTEAVRRWEARGIEVAVVPPEPDGVVRAERFLAAVTDDTRLACLMLANNVLGTIQPVKEVAAGCRERGVRLLCDAVQAVGKIPVGVEDLGVDYLSVGAHKLHGPLGAAALWIRPDAPFEPLLRGGSQERRRRAGTVNVLAVAGFGEACRLAERDLAERGRRLRELRDAFETGLDEVVSGAVIHGREAPRLPNTSHVAFPGVEAEALAIRLDLAGFAVSTGSACSSGVVEPSPLLLAMGVPPKEAVAAIRVSFGIQNSLEEVSAFLPVLGRELAALREASPVSP